MRVVTTTELANQHAIILDRIADLEKQLKRITKIVLEIKEFMGSEYGFVTPDLEAAVNFTGKIADYVDEKVPDTTVPPRQKQQTRKKRVKPYQ